MRKNKVGGITIPDIKLYYKATVSKRAWYWHKNRHIDQWNRIESPEIIPSLYGQLIFDKGGRSIKWNKDSLFITLTGRSGQVHAKKKKKETPSPTYTTQKNKFRWIKDLNISCDTIKVLEENTDRKISDIPHRNIFTDMSPRARDIKERINKWDLMKIKSFSTAKEKKH